MCEHDAPSRVKRSRGQIADEQAVFGIDSGRSNSGIGSDVSNHGLNHGPNTPVE